MTRRVLRKPPKDGPPPTFLCHNRVEVTRALAAIREHMGLSQLDVDDIAGFCPGYTGKLERHSAPAGPGKRASGRSAINPMFDLLVGALKVAVIVGPSGSDLAMAVPTRPHVAPPVMTLKRAEKIRALHAAGRSANSLWRMFGTSPRMVAEILAGRAYRPHD